MPTAERGTVPAPVAGVGATEITDRDASRELQGALAQDISAQEEFRERQSERTAI